MSMAINPEFAAAKEIAHLIQVPDAMEIDTFAKGRIDLLRVAISQNSPLHNMTVQEFSKHFNHEILICILVHDHQVSIPNGDTILQAGDTISVIIPKENIRDFYKATKLSTLKEIKDVIIAGGGTISYYLSTLLLSSGIHVKIIEKDKDRCDFLSVALPDATIIYADATDHSILQEEGLANTDAFVSLTNMDEENVFLSLYANKLSPRCKKITKINRLALNEVIDDLSVGSIISPKHITAEYILQYVRSLSNSYGSNVEALYRLMDNKVEALEFHVAENSSVTGIPLIDLNLKDNLLICCIVRDKNIITPSGRDTLELNYYTQRSAGYLGYLKKYRKVGILYEFSIDQFHIEPCHHAAGSTAAPLLPGRNSIQRMGRCIDISYCILCMFYCRISYVSDQTQKFHLLRQGRFRCCITELDHNESYWRYAALFYQ